VHETTTGGIPPVGDGMVYGTVLRLLPVTGTVMFDGQEISGGPNPAGGGGSVGWLGPFAHPAPPIQPAATRQAYVVTRRAHDELFKVISTVGLRTDRRQGRP
jgi:hypothetical protein